MIEVRQTPDSDTKVQIADESAEKAPADAEMTPKAHGSWGYRCLMFGV